MKVISGRIGVVMLIIAVILLHTAISPAATFEVTTADTGGADTYVQGHTPDSPAGGSWLMYVKNEGGASYSRKAYLRFSVPSASSRSVMYSNVTLTLAVKAVDKDATFNVYGLDNGDAGETWGELTTTWNNAPGNSTNSGGSFLSNASLLGSFSVTNGLPVGTLVSMRSDELAYFVNQDTNNMVTLMVAGLTGGALLNMAAHEDIANHPSPTLAGEEGPIWSTTAQGAGADAYIQGGAAADSNLGTGPSLRLKRSIVDYTRKTYLRFDLRRPEDGWGYTNALLQAVITLNTTSDDRTYRVYGLDDGDAGEAWGESTITWNNAPANATNSSLEFLSNASLLGTFEVTNNAPVGQVVAFSGADLTSFLNDDSNGTVTLMIAAEEADASVFELAAGESANYAPPRLTAWQARYQGTLILIK